MKKPSSPSIPPHLLANMIPPNEPKPNAIQSRKRAKKNRPPKKEKKKKEAIH
jgi:hypothetical protein